MGSDRKSVQEGFGSGYPIRTGFVPRLSLRSLSLRSDLVFVASSSPIQLEVGCSPIRTDVPL